MPNRRSDDSVPNLFDLGPDGSLLPDDTIEPAAGSLRWNDLRARRRELTVVGVAFVVAVVIAYLLGSHSGRTSAADSRSTPSVSADVAPTGSLRSPVLTVVQTGAQCATQTGGQLELGIEFTNQSVAPVQLMRVDPVLPLGGLRADRNSFGPCGELGRGGAVTEATVAPGARAWISSVFDVLVTCPEPLPVQFAITYLQGSRTATVTLGGFSDLGGVTYSGCDASH